MIRSCVVIADGDRTRIEELAEAISEELEDIQVDLRRASSAGSATSGLESWSGAPTADQLWAIANTWELLPGVIERINAALMDRMPELESLLSEVGVRPDLGEPIRVPPGR